MELLDRLEFSASLSRSWACVLLGFALAEFTPPQVTRAYRISGGCEQRKEAVKTLGGPDCRMFELFDKTIYKAVKTGTLDPFLAAISPRSELHFRYPHSLMYSDVLIFALIMRYQPYLLILCSLLRPVHSASNKSGTPLSISPSLYW